MANKNLTLTLEEALEKIQKGQSIDFVELIGHGSINMCIDSMDKFKQYRVKYKGRTVMAFETYQDYLDLKNFGNGDFPRHFFKL
ncbi:MAG: hypothetical protein WC606_04050 [Candidatus Absconditabacterales bacterium]|jgi:hypothetical protein